MQHEEMTLEQAGDDDLVHLKMLAAPVNPADINQIQGTYPLKNPGRWHVGGNEGVARVLAVKRRATDCGGSAKKVESVPAPVPLQPGDLVIPNSGALGTWREQLVTSSRNLYRLPSSAKELPLEVIATLLVNPPTAWRLLTDFGHLSPGDVVIQNGANSAVGRYVIQMARARGLRTVNIIRDRPGYEQLEQELLSLGATVVVKAERFSLLETRSYIREHLLGGALPRLGLNCVSGLATMDMADFLEPSSSLVTYGGMSRRQPVISTGALIFKDIRFLGFWMSRWYQQATVNEQLARERDQMLQNIIEMFRQGQLKAPCLHRLSFATEWRSVIDYYSGDSRAGKGSAGHAIGELKPLFIFE